MSVSDGSVTTNLSGDLWRVAYEKAAEAINELRDENDRFRAENDRLRKISAYVPAGVWIKAKQSAGFGNVVRANFIE